MAEAEALNATFFIITITIRMTEIDSAIIMAAVELLRLRENHPHLTKFQKNIVINLVNQKSSVNQLPTGSGKTLPIILLPMILDIFKITSNKMSQMSVGSFI